MMNLDALIARLQAIRKKRGNIQVAVQAGYPDELWNPVIVERKSSLGVTAVVSFRGEPVGALVKPLSWT